ncbi:MAG: hypothetical protein M0019_10430 [Actinomycetota bacterium]|nr:hypothetical protein [Actinomycetota bacterium]
MTISQEKLAKTSAGSFEDWLNYARSANLDSAYGRGEARGSVASSHDERRSAASDERQNRPSAPRVRRGYAPAQAAAAAKPSVGLKAQMRLDVEGQPTYRPVHLRPLPTGEELKELRRPVLVKRFFYLSSITALAVAVLIGVVAQAEIGKMSLSVAGMNSTISSLNASNQQLSLTEASLDSPARIASIAQSKLHMTFATANGLSSNSHLALYSASSQPYSEYYTPGGEAPTTTLAPVKAGQSSVAGASQPLANTLSPSTTVVAKAPSTAVAVTPTTVTSASATTVPPTTTASPATTLPSSTSSTSSNVG